MLVTFFDIKRGPLQAVNTLNRKTLLINLCYKDDYSNRKKWKSCKRKEKKKDKWSVCFMENHKTLILNKYKLKQINIISPLLNWQRLKISIPIRVGKYVGKLEHCILLVGM